MGVADNLRWPGTSAPGLPVFATAGIISSELSVHVQRCTPRSLNQGMSADQSVINAFYEKVTSVATDGAKSVRKAALIMERMRFALPDRAHQIRRASIPLTLENRFRTFWDKVFSKRQALVPDLQNSAEWQMRFQTMENELKGQSDNDELPGEKQRFDSMATPASKFVALVQPFRTLVGTPEHRPAARPAGPVALARDAASNGCRACCRLDFKS